MQIEHRRSEHDGQAVGKARQGFGGLLDQVIKLRSAFPELVGRFLATFVLLLAAFLGKQIVDEGAVALIGGDPACRGMRLGDIAPVLENRKLVAHGRRAYAELITFGKRARTYRQSARDVFLNERCKHFLTPIRKHASPPSFHPLRYNQFVTLNISSEMVGVLNIAPNRKKQTPPYARSNRAPYS